MGKESTPLVGNTFKRPVKHSTRIKLIKKTGRERKKKDPGVGGNPIHFPQRPQRESSKEWRRSRQKREPKREVTNE